MKNLPEAFTTKPFKIVAIVSGPEPQRKILEDILESELVKADLPALLVQGLPCENYPLEQTFGNLKKVSFMDTEKLMFAINKSETVICRCGYSSVMDMVTLNKKAVFIPTPGQPEQEYLAARLTENKWFYHESQDNFNLLRALERSKNFSFPASGSNLGMLTGLIERLKKNQM